jgi:ribonuclease T1
MKITRNCLKILYTGLIAICLLTGAAGCIYPTDDNTYSTLSSSSQSGIETINIEDLPAEAITTLGLIENGGPFPYTKDGSVFYNYEGLLPQKTAGYYHEYTVETPGSSDRGARRIVSGANGEYYYTDDHYASFKLIVE